MKGMRQFWASIAFILAGASAGWAQTQLDPATMQQLQQVLQQNGGGMNAQQIQQQIQQVIGNQTINMREQRSKVKTDCDENRFMQCERGYSCTSSGAGGAMSRTTVRGRGDGLCHVLVSNSDGSKGECRYTDATMEAMLALYRAETVTVAQAMDSGSRMMRECQFVDAQGKPFAMPMVNGMSGGAQ